MTRSFFAAGLVGLVAASAAPAQGQYPVHGPTAPACEAECGGWSGGCFGKFSRWLCFRQTPTFFGLKPTPYHPPLYAWFPTKECGHAGCGTAGCAATVAAPAVGPVAAPWRGPVVAPVSVHPPAPTLPPPPMTSLQTGRPGNPAVVPAGFRLPARSSVTPIPVNGTR